MLIRNIGYRRNKCYRNLPNSLRVMVVELQFSQNIKSAYLIQLQSYYEY